MRPWALGISVLNKDDCSMGGRMNEWAKELNAGDSGGWLRTSVSSSMSMSWSILLDSVDMQTIESGDSKPP